MTKEFRPIEKAPLYEMDKDGNIQKVDSKVSAIPYPTGSANVILTLTDGRRATFKIADLIAETFGEKKEVVAEDSLEEIKEERVVAAEPLEEEFQAQMQEEKIEEIEKEKELIADEVGVEVTSEKSERAKDTEAMPSSGKVTAVKKETRGRKAKPKAPKKDFSNNPMIGKIMALNTFDSVKIWKLHNIGVSNEDITELVDALHVTVITKMLEQYNAKEKLRVRAEKVIVK